MGPESLHSYTSGMLIFVVWDHTLRTSLIHVGEELCTCSQFTGHQALRKALHIHTDISKKYSLYFPEEESKRQTG